MGPGNQPSGKTVYACENNQSGDPHLAGLLALAAAMGIGRFVFTPIVPIMAAGVPLSPSQVGLIASANFLGYLAGAVLASATLLPGSRRAWLVGGLAVSALTTLAMGLTGSLAMFLLLRFAGGLASAFVLIFSSALLLDRLALAGRPEPGRRASCRRWYRHPPLRHLLSPQSLRWGRIGPCFGS
jgi:MFS family permease